MSLHDLLLLQPPASGGIPTIRPAGIASAEAFGTPTFVNRATVSPTGIASAEAFGTPTFINRATVAPTGIPSAEAFGTPTVSWRTQIVPSGIASAEAFGSPAFVRTGPSIARLIRRGLGLRGGIWL